DALRSVSRQLAPEDFFIERHRLMFKAMLELARDGRSVDVLTVADQLRDDGMLEAAGGPAALSILLEHASILSHLSEYITIVSEPAVKRTVVREAMLLLDKARNGVSVADLVSRTADLAEQVRERAVLAKPAAGLKPLSAVL